ncbi:MAG: galactokinase [Chloroflexi bacterium]|nr:galactokinase [Chloroflexota bacterium]
MPDSLAEGQVGDAAQRLRAAFRSRYQAEPALVARAPGRVNLIGEHTDYNDGFVMPLAIDRAVWIAARPRDDGRVSLHSLNFGCDDEFALDGIARAGGAAAWSNYLRGVAVMLQQAGHRLRGMDAVVWGDVPVGSGLSSSAAVQVAAALSYAAVSGLSIAPVEVARLTQRAEVEFVGVNCGIMDQMICVLGQAGHALLIDCRSLEYCAVPIPDGVAILVADTMKRRELVDSHYNTRRAECAEGAERLGVSSLRDVTPDQFRRQQASLPEPVRSRCRHVIGENVRVERCLEALQAGDLRGVGALLNQSHASLRDDYDVSCRELDVMVAAAQLLPGVYGARMTGAGFGGCTVNLVEQEQADWVAAELAATYKEQIGIYPTVYVCHATDGALIVTERF